MTAEAQPTIFDLAPHDGPTCPRCGAPAGWDPTTKRVGTYCAGRTCNARVRICANCRQQYDRTTTGAGTKYCTTECKNEGYKVGYVKASCSLQCAWCNRPGGVVNGGRGKWPYICDDCIAPIKHVVHRLKAHNVTHDRARRLTSNPGCEVCGADILAQVRDRDTGRLRSTLVVDHDHRCCSSGSYSCGRCVRGMLCANCNTAAGMLHDAPAVAVALAAYLQSYVDSLPESLTQSQGTEATTVGT